MFNKPIFRQLCHLWDNVEKWCRAGHVADNSTALAHYMLDKKAANTYPEYEVFIDFRGQ